MDYILGDNPRATSYMVGYGNNFPQRVHHRGSSIVSYKVDRTFVTCRGGYATWYGRKGSDPNLLTGAIVGGPDAYDNFADRRDNYEQTEPATYNNAPLLGVLARLSSGHSGYSQLLPGLCLRFKTFPHIPETKLGTQKISFAFVVSLQWFLLLLSEDQCLFVNREWLVQSEVWVCVLLSTCESLSFYWIETWLCWLLVQLLVQWL